MSPEVLDKNWHNEIEQAVEYVSLIDADDRLLYVNHIDDPSTITGLSVYSFVAPEYHDEMRNAIATARATGIPQRYSSHAVSADGGQALYSNWVVALSAPAPPGVVAFIALDVTREEHFEAQLELSEKMLGSLLDNSPDTIVVVDRSRTVVYASKQDYGAESSEIIGLSTDLFVDEQDLPVAIAEFERVLEQGVNGAYETTVETAIGPRRFSTRLVPIRNRGTIDRVMIVATDTTDQYEAAREQAQLREQLQQSQKMESIGQLTGGVAHDFNNILLTISGNLELALIDIDKPDASSVLIEDALDGVAKARDLIQRLLAFSRRQPLTPEIVNVGYAIEGMNVLLRRTIGENINIRIDGSGCMDHVCRLDRAQFENAILNLAINARDAMPSGGELSIGAAWIEPALASFDAPLGCVRVAVSDTGTGMDPDTMAFAIEPFFTTKKVGSGSGLGLSMVYGFTKQSGGTIQLKSEAGIGTTVELDLPCIEPAVVLKTPDEEQPAPRGNGEVILVVEDEASVREMTATLLQSIGYTVVTAADGPRALTVLHARDDIDLLLTDVVMPGGLDGFELADRCRQLRPRLPIMLVSGHPLESGEAGTRDTWLEFLLKKPYRSEELASFVAKMLRQPS